MCSVVDNTLKNQRKEFLYRISGEFFQHKIWALAKEKLHALIKLLFLKFMILTRIPI